MCVTWENCVKPSSPMCKKLVVKILKNGKCDKSFNVLVGTSCGSMRVRLTSRQITFSPLLKKQLFGMKVMRKLIASFVVENQSFYCLILLGFPLLRECKQSRNKCRRFLRIDIF